MKVDFKFFHNEKWSVIASINTLIPIILLYIFKIKLDIKTLTLSSLIGMMSGELMSKIIFYIFISLIFFEKDINYVKLNAIFIMSIIILNNKTLNDKIRNISNKKYIIYLFRIIILLWFLYFFNMLYKY